jgi:hypothetical protein
MTKRHPENERIKRRYVLYLKDAKGRDEASIDAATAAIERFEDYNFHKILKSGCRAEDAKLRTTDRLASLVAVFCIVSWRVMWLTMMARAAPDAPPTIALTSSEITILDRFISNSGNRSAIPNTLQFYLTKLGRLGGYLARASDPPPGNTVVWRGLRRLADIQLGAEMTGDPRCG